MYSAVCYTVLTLKLIKKGIKVKRIKQVPLKHKVGAVLLLAALVSNPLTGQYVLDAIERAFTELFIYGAWVSLVFTLYLLVMGAWAYYKLDPVKIPKGKTKTQAYIET